MRRRRRGRWDDRGPARLRRIAGPRPWRRQKPKRLRKAMEAAFADAGWTPAEAAAAVLAVFDALAELLARHEKFRIPGVGTFKCQYWPRNHYVLRGGGVLGSGNIGKRSEGYRGDCWVLRFKGEALPCKPESASTDARPTGSELVDPDSGPPANERESSPPTTRPGESSGP